MSLSDELEPDWVNDYDESDDERDPDQERDHTEALDIEDSYDRWIETHMGWRR